VSSGVAVVDGAAGAVANGSILPIVTTTVPTVLHPLAAVLPSGGPTSGSVAAAPRAHAPSTPFTPPAITAAAVARSKGAPPYRASIGTGSSHDTNPPGVPPSPQRMPSRPVVPAVPSNGDGGGWALVGHNGPLGGVPPVMLALLLLAGGLVALHRDTLTRLLLDRRYAPPG
jgi:hypothetical protein